MGSRFSYREESLLGFWGDHPASISILIHFFAFMAYLERDTACASCGFVLHQPQRCSACQSVAYCSVACQRAHWKAGHKKSCKTAASASFAESFRRATTKHASGVDMHNVGACYEQGVGVPKNDKEAVRWFRAAADAGFMRANFCLGNCYADGRGVTQDHAESVRLFQLAAQAGDVDAQYALACCYSMERSAWRNGTTAAMWLRKAAEAGHAEAQFALATTYLSLDGGATDTVSAALWLRKAAAQGHADAKSFCVEWLGSAT